MRARLRPSPRPHGTASRGSRQRPGCRLVPAIFVVCSTRRCASRSEGPQSQSAVAHFGWNVPAVESYLEKFRGLQLRLVPMHADAEGSLVDLSSDALPGYLTGKQITDARTKGMTPARAGGFLYVQGPDGAMIESYGDFPAERFTHIHMYHRHPICAQQWYARHLGAYVAASHLHLGPGRTEQGTADDCRRPLAEPTYPAFGKEGRIRHPDGYVLFESRSSDVAVRRRSGQYPRTGRRSHWSRRPRPSRHRGETQGGGGHGARRHSPMERHARSAHRRTRSHGSRTDSRKQNSSSRTPGAALDGPPAAAPARDEESGCMNSESAVVRCLILVFAAALAAACSPGEGDATSARRQRPPSIRASTAHEHPDLSGVWQALNEANSGFEGHAARRPWPFSQVSRGISWFRQRRCWRSAPEAASRVARRRRGRRDPYRPEALRGETRMPHTRSSATPR